MGKHVSLFMSAIALVLEVRALALDPVGDRGLPDKRTRAVFVDREGTACVAGNHELYAQPRGSRTFALAATGLGIVGCITQATDGSISASRAMRTASTMGGLVDR